jgi:hypothetical protein
MIVGRPVAKVSSSGEGCTFKNEAYEAIIGDTVFNVYDTAPLDEGDQGRVPHWEAIRALYTLIRQLSGVSLLIYCMRGRVRENAMFNWILFNRVICGEKVPIVAVVTGLETFNDPDEWWRKDENKNAFKKNGMRPKDVACVVSFPGRQNELAEIYAKSIAKVRSLITKNYLHEPWSEEKAKWFANIYHDVFVTRLCFVLTIQLDYSTIMRNLIFDLIKATKMEDDDAERLRAALLNAEKTFRERGEPNLISKTSSKELHGPIEACPRFSVQSFELQMNGLLSDTIVTVGIPPEDPTESLFAPGTRLHSASFKSLRSFSFHSAKSFVSDRISFRTSNLSQASLTSRSGTLSFRIRNESNQSLFPSCSPLKSLYSYAS